MKKCSKCLVNKHLDEFGMQRSSRDGKQAYCKLCRKEYDADRKNRQKVFVTEKSCASCNIIKPRSEYYRHDRFKDGLQTHCKDCEKKRSSSKYRDNPEYVKAWNRKNIDKYRVNMSKSDAKRRGLKGALTPADGYLPTAQELSHAYGSACLYPGCDSDKPTIDHVVPLSRGGIHDVSNMQPLCHSHNSKKRVGSEDYRDFIWLGPKIVRSNLTHI